MKKRIGLVLTVIMVLSMGGNVYAAEVGKDSLTPEQKAVIETYENNAVISVNSTMESKSISPRAGWRGSFYRGSALMWTEDWIEWYASNGQITSSTGWQEAGYIFPNIARATGISKHSSSSSSVTYRAQKTIGAGVVTPWGDVNVYEENFSDFLQGTASDGFDAW